LRAGGRLASGPASEALPYYRNRHVKNAHACLYAWATRVVHRAETVSEKPEAELLGAGDDSAGDAVASVAGGIRLHVVGLLVDHDGGTAVGEERVGGGGVE